MEEIEKTEPEIEVDYDDEVAIINFWDRGVQLVLGKDEMKVLIRELIDAMSV